MQSIQKTISFFLLLLLCLLGIQETALAQLRNNRNNTNTKAPTKVAPVKSQSQITKEVERHFKGMKYSYDILSDDRSKIKAVQSFQGKGTIKKAGKSLQYKWYMTTDSQGNIVHMYAGDNFMPGFRGNMGLTRGEHKRRKSACRGKQGEARKRCFDRLWSDTMQDCLLAFDNKSECKKDCWFRGGYCIK